MQQIAASRRSALKPPSPRTRGGVAGYMPPDQWRTTLLRDLIAGTERDNLKPQQIDWVNAVTSSSGAAGALFTAGDEALLKGRCIAIIGARKASEDGRRRARRLARQLVDAGIVIVSGLADGIDEAALSAAVEAGGRVVAVIGTPLSQAYPAKNKRLQELIYREHLLISQFPAGSRVFPSNFPARNRTMAALTDASVVIEASDTSGTLHQAAECVRLNRWLGVAQSVAQDPALSWPQKFDGYEKYVRLETTPQLIDSIYG